MVNLNDDIEFVYRTAAGFQNSKEENPAAYKAYTSLCDARAAIEDAVELLTSNPGVSMKTINAIKTAAAKMGEVQDYMLEVK